MARPLAGFDPLDPETRRNPYPHWARARAQGALLAHPDSPVLSAFRYAEVDAVLRDAERWSSQVQPAFGGELPDPMIALDGADHARLRGLVNLAFTPRRVRRLEPRIAAIAEELLAPGLARGRLELVADFAHPLPVIVIAELIGVPPEDREWFRSWSDFLVESVGAGLLAPLPSREVRARQRAVLGEMCQYFAVLAEERRRAPRDDLLSALVAAELEGSRLGPGEMLAMLVLLLVAGNETTRTLIGNAVRTLLEHPGPLELLRADPLRIAAAVEEVLRFAAPLPVTARRAAKSFRFGKDDVEEGQILLVWLGSANRDGAVFPDPERFELGRVPNRHLSFGFGPHYCLGANLARLEAEIALRTLLARSRAFAIATSEPLPLHPSFAINAVTKLPIEVEAS